MAEGTIPVVILGGTGYVAGELLRLLAHHPRFKVAATISTSQVGEPVVASFPHLEGTPVADLKFEDKDSLDERFSPGAPIGIFAATPHGATAALLDEVLRIGEEKDARVRAVDLSADFRFPSPNQYEEIYGHPHGAPARVLQFHCTVPEQFPGKPAKHACQPGCFTTAVTLAAWPFVKLNLVEGPVFASAITGSSGSGRKLGQGTHHPERHSNLFAYKSPFGHRHEAEMRRLIGFGGPGDVDVEFIPHSGTHVRGIYATLRMNLKAEARAEDLVAQVNDLYRESPFVRASTDSPRITEVVGTNRCRLGIAVRGKTLVVTSAIDNLVKGAAGGAVQWMNRLFDLDEACGLDLPGLGWL